MDLLTWTDPNYFKFANALIRSIRYSKNENIIHLALMDFDNNQFDHVQSLFKNDSKINFIRINKNDFKDINIKTDENFYRNFRPRLFKELLTKSEDGKLCTFGANGIVFANLKYIENDLDENDFVFMEREKNNIFTSTPKTVKSIEDVKNLVVNNNLNIDKVLDATTGKVVLLGTHAMRNNETVLNVLSKWSDLIENTSAMNKKFSDMNLFVKAYIQEELENNVSIKSKTGKDLPREKNPYCDTLLLEGNKIWFGKGPDKFNNKKYLDVVKYFSEYDYIL